MNTTELRDEVKKIIDTADDTTVKMIHAMLEVKQETDWWNDLPEDVQEQIDNAVKELDNGKGISHDKMQEMYPQWFKK